MIPTITSLSEVVPITWGSGEAARFLLRAADTGGQFSLYEVSVPAGDGSLRHHHEKTDETFFITAGEFEFTVGNIVQQATVGTVVFGPRQVWHSFKNTGSDLGRMLCIMSPGGIEDFFEELSQLLLTGPTWAQLHELALSHHIHALPPTTSGPLAANGQPAENLETSS